MRKIGVYRRSAQCLQYLVRGVASGRPISLDEVEPDEKQARGRRSDELDQPSIGRPSGWNAKQIPFIEEVEAQIGKVAEIRSALSRRHIAPRQTVPGKRQLCGRMRSD